MMLLVTYRSLENNFAHLVNNSIGKNSENFNKTVSDGCSSSR
jgi:hypothetical protein